MCILSPFQPIIPTDISHDQTNQNFGYLFKVYCKCNAKHGAWPYLVTYHATHKIYSLPPCTNDTVQRVPTLLSLTENQDIYTCQHTETLEQDFTVKHSWEQKRAELSEKETHQSPNLSNTHPQFESVISTEPFMNSKHNSAGKPKIIIMNLLYIKTRQLKPYS